MCEGFQPACATPTGNNVLTVSSALQSARWSSSQDMGPVVPQNSAGQFWGLPFCNPAFAQPGQVEPCAWGNFCTSRWVACNIPAPIPGGANKRPHPLCDLVGLCLFPTAHEWDKATVQQIQCDSSADMAGFPKLTAAHGVGIGGQCLRNFFI